MTAWRITSARHVSDMASGLGGLYAAGQWHEKGVPIQYTSDHPSTALLELLVNASAAKLSAEGYVVVRLDVPDDAVLRIALDALPLDWQQHPHSDSTRALGMRWLIEREWLALDVPSAVFPMARNIVLNPGHPRMGDVRIGEAERLVLDERLVRAPSEGTRP